MKKILCRCLAVTLLAFALTAHGQGVTNIFINRFDTSDELTPWGNWFGGAFQSVVWDSSDASNNPSSGSMLITAVFTGAGQQFMVYDGNNGITPPLDGHVVTNFQCDIRFDASSPTNTGGNYGTIMFGSRGTDFGQYLFGNYFSVPAGQTNWVHVSLPIDMNVQPKFATIPNVLCQIQTFGGAATVINGTVKLYVDNIKFVGLLVAPSNPPPTLTIEKARPGLRMFAGSTGTIFDREMLATVDQSESWINGTFPVSYSFTILRYPTNGNIGQTHIFLIPTSTSPVGAYGYNGVDFLATNELWMVINPQAGGGVVANVEWKTNLPNANPDHRALRITNSTAVGKWTLTFNSNNSGTLTAPGASPAPFTITNDTVAADFANPMASYFGLQPNSAAGEGEYEDWASISVTNGIGGIVHQDFTTSDVISGDWMDMSALAGSLVLVTTNTPLWINWTTPDDGFENGLATKANLSDPTTPWNSPQFWNGITPVVTRMGPSRKWTLLPKECLPTVDGQPASAPSSKGFFRLSNPPPAQ